jgi:metal-responsive CopG/Arc/MetJ family transcriptional regulator
MAHLEFNMTIQTQFFLPDEIVNELERRVPQPENRSTLIAEALRYFFATHKEPNELELINQHAAELNQEAEDVLSYQVSCEQR